MSGLEDCADAALLLLLRLLQEGSRVWVKDVQGNDITITKKPILFGDVSIIPIDKVLMSGGYFFTGKVRTPWVIKGVILS